MSKMHSERETPKPKHVERDLMGVAGDLGRGPSEEEYEIYGRYNVETVLEHYDDWDTAVRSTGYKA